MRGARFEAVIVLAGACALLTSPACSLAMRPVPLDAGPETLETLAGRWRGEYTMTVGPRHGRIEFQLTTTTHEAVGDVLMIPERAAPSDSTAREISPEELEWRQSQLLSIRFVSADPHSVRGATVPYWDPDRNCRATASFSGAVVEERIVGTFVSTCEDGIRALEGKWKVARTTR